VSGGQQQRASLGRALVRDAGLYLLDEPMGQLEPQLRAVLRGRIKHYLRENRCTTILVTHDQTEANALADRIAVMEGGVLQQYATPAELKERPANLFTGTFIGEPPMNVFDADLSVDSRKLKFAIPGGVELAYAHGAFSRSVRDALAGRNRIGVGVRPHALQPGKGPISGRIASCQWLGDQTHIAADVGGRIVVSVSHEKVRLPAGAAISFDVVPQNLHLFDAESGKAIAHGGELA
jgi:multiple sugar transport system ATP-binding protein